VILSGSICMKLYTQILYYHESSGAVGTVYPAYASFKAIEYMRVQGDTDEATRWLMYWAIYSLFSMTEKLGKPILNW